MEAGQGRPRGGPSRLMWAAIAVTGFGVLAQGILHLTTREGQIASARTIAQEEAGKARRAADDANS